MAGLIAAALGGSTISAVSQLGTAGIQTGQQQSVIDQGLTAYRSAGIPDFMYFSGQQMHMPNTNVSLGGSNYYNTTGVNLNTPTITNDYQQYNKTGKPSNVVYGPKNSSTAPSPSPVNSRAGIGSSDFVNNHTNFMSQGKPLMWSSSGNTSSNFSNIGSKNFNPRMAPNPAGSSNISNQMSAIWDM